MARIAPCIIMPRVRMRIPQNVSGTELIPCPGPAQPAQPVYWLAVSSPSTKSRVFVPLESEILLGVYIIAKAIL